MYNMHSYSMFNLILFCLMKISLNGITEPKTIDLVSARVIKVSEADALSFTRKQYRQYSRKFSPLKEGENYNGYAIINYGRGKLAVAMIEGALKKVTNGNVTKYKLEKGGFHRVQTFGDIPFEDTIEYLQDRGVLPRAIDAEDLTQILREKLVRASVHRDEELILSQDELLILNEHFGSDCFQRYVH